MHPTKPNQVRVRERVPTGRRGRPSKSMIAAAMERPFCAYLHKICLNNRLEGHKYCIDHIMNDKTAPYRQCTYVHVITGRRCPRAAHKVDRRASPLCLYHRALRLNTPHTSQIQTVELANDTKNDPKKALMENLAHHKPSLPEEPQPKTTNTYWLPLENGAAVPSNKLVRLLATYNVKRLTEDLEPLEMPTAEDIAIRHNNADSDTESVDNSYDLFKNASVYTEEEVLRTLRDKMIRLRRLYIEQYSHIQYLLKEKRLKYIQAQRLEDEMYGDIFSFRNYPDSPGYKRLRAMLKYHKTFGGDALLQEQAKKKKQSRPLTIGPHPHPNPQLNSSITNNSQEANKQVLDQPNTLTANNANHAGSTDSSHQVATITPGATTNDTQTVARIPDGPAQHMPDETLNGAGPNYCIFSKTPQGCDKSSLPLSPYCRQHILYDNKQVLFRPCAGGMPPCLTPVVSFTRKNKCWLHTTMN